jgi:uncharacterized phage-associated protein
MYSVIDISKYIISKLNIKITNLKLQSLLYYVQAYSLLKNNRTLYKEEIVARKLGVIIPVAHNAFKWSNSSEILIIEKPSKIIEEKDKEIIDAILTTIGELSSETLIDKIRSYGTWKESFENVFNKIIYPEDIKRYHKKIKEKTNYYFS